MVFNVKVETTWLKCQKQEQQKKYGWLRKMEEGLLEGSGINKWQKFNFKITVSGIVSLGGIRT